MTTFAPKTYQQQVLDSAEAYFKACHELPSPSIAFSATTERLWGRGNPYNPLAGFPADMPYFCLRVPTGGGKTHVALHAMAGARRPTLVIVPTRVLMHQWHEALRATGGYYAQFRGDGLLALYGLHSSLDAACAQALAGAAEMQALGRLGHYAVGFLERTLDEGVLDVVEVFLEVEAIERQARVHGLGVPWEFGLGRRNRAGAVAAAHFVGQLVDVPNYIVSAILPLEIFQD